MKRMWSKNELKAIQAALLASGELPLIIADKIYQDKYNWESDNISLNTTYLHGLVVEDNAYIKCVETNKSLHLIVSCIVKNTTEASITTSAVNPLFASKITIPESIAKKIYRKEGTTCDQALETAKDGVINQPFIVTNPSGGSATSLNALIVSDEANKLNVWMASGNSFSVGAGEERYLDFRVEILL